MDFGTEDSISPMGLMTILFETFFFGAYSSLFIFSTILLFKRSVNGMRRAMMALTMVMYVVSAIHWAIDIARVNVLWFGFTGEARMIQIFVMYLPTINYILSDVIVLWRAWVLWNRRVLLFIPPMISLICTIGATIASAIYFYESFTVTGIDDSKRILAIYLEWTIWFLTFGTNLWATTLIFIRAWQHRRFLRSLSVKQTLKGKSEKALAFLIESGALYLFIWLLYISTSISLDPYGMFFFHTSMAQVVGMYPTTIVIVVAMRLSTADILSRPGVEADSPIVFMPLPQSPQPQIAESAHGYSMSSNVASPHVLVIGPYDEQE